MYVPLVREMVKILMESSCYFHLKLEERHRLVKYLLLESGVCAQPSIRRPAAINVPGGFVLKGAAFSGTSIALLTLKNPMDYHEAPFALRSGRPIPDAPDGEWPIPDAPCGDGFVKNTVRKS